MEKQKKSGKARESQGIWKEEIMEILGTEFSFKVIM